MSFAVFILSEMEQNIKVPARARRSDRTAGMKTDLESTLRYLCVLLRADMDHKKTSIVETGIQAQANEMGMDRRRFQRLLEHPDWALARKVAEKQQASRSREKTFGNYVFKHLSDDAKETWEKLKFWVDHQDGAQQIRQIVEGKAKRIRQELFIHALVSTHYDMSRALMMTGLPKTALDNWRSDLHFAQLFDEIQWHKKNFFEKAMMDLVADRNPLATVWVNKTVNADRGYSEKIQVQHVGKDLGFSFEDLDLDIDTRRKVLEAIRRRQERQAPKLLPEPVTDVEVVEET